MGDVSEKLLSSVNLTLKRIRHSIELLGDDTNLIVRIRVNS